MLRPALAALGLLCVHASQAEPLHVPSQYPTIQAAIDASQPGDEIHIAAGVYRELLSPENKSVTLIGAGAGETILSGDLDGDTVADGVILDYQNGSVDVLPFVTIRDIDFTLATRAISIGSVATLDIYGCNFTNCRRAVYAGGGVALNAQLTNCVFERCGYLGPSFSEPACTLIADIVNISACKVQNCRIGIGIQATQGAVENCVFKLNDGYYSSLSIYSQERFDIADCLFESNSTFNRHNPPLTLNASAPGIWITDSQFLNNTGDFGSAAFITGPCHFKSCEFRGNIGDLVGPLNVFADRDIPTTIVDCVFTDNGYYDPSEGAFPYGGGAVCLEEGSLIVRDSVFRHNMARNAGAIMLNRGNACLIDGNHFEGNHAISNRAFSGRSGVAGGGGAITVLNDIKTSITNSAFIGNSAFKGYGGDIYVSRRSPFVSNCVFVNSIAESGSTIFQAYNLNLYEHVFKIRPRASVFVGLTNHQAMFQSPGGAFQLSDPENLITTDLPSIRFTRPPSDGGDGFGDDPRTPDIDESLNDDFGDLRLLAGSPAIDAGGNAKLPRDVYDLDRDGDTAELLVGTTDLAGNPRFVDDPDAPNLYDLAGQAGPIDLGPYEFQPPALAANCPADTNRDGVLTAADFTAWIAAFNAGAPECDQNADGTCTPADYTAWIAGFNAGC